MWLDCVPDLGIKPLKNNNTGDRKKERERLYFTGIQCCHHNSIAPKQPSAVMGRGATDCQRETSASQEKAQLGVHPGNKPRLVIPLCNKGSYVNLVRNYVIAYFLWEYPTQTQVRQNGSPVSVICPLVSSKKQEWAGCSSTFPSLFSCFAPHNLLLLIILDVTILMGLWWFSGVLLCTRLQSFSVATVNTEAIKEWKRIDSVLLCRIRLSTSSPHIRRNWNCLL